MSNSHSLSILGKKDSFTIFFKLNLINFLPTYPIFFNLQKFQSKIILPNQINIFRPGNTIFPPFYNFLNFYQNTALHL